MKSRKIGTLSTIFNLKSDISRYILMGAFEKVGAGSNDMSTQGIQELFKIKIKEERNSLMIQSFNDQLKIAIGQFQKSRSQNTKFEGAIVTKEQFYLHYDTLEVFYSEH